MAMRNSPFLWFLMSFLFSSGTWAAAQQDTVHILVNVNLVQLNIAVTDRKGNYISGLRPEDFVITEDRIPEKIATFEEGNEPTRTLVNTPPFYGGALTQGDGHRQGAVPQAPFAQMPQPRAQGSTTIQPQAQTLDSLVQGANIFILFDTSNYMYREFVFAQDAITDFIRSMEGANKVAFYSYSRDLSRDAPLSSDRSQVLRGVRNTVAGDDAALYNCLLLTVEDAARYAGRKVIVVFSNGPDNSSLVPPEDVAELAQSTGTIIYMISTREAQREPVSAAVFERMSKDTGGKAYFAKTWGDERRAFVSIRDDLAHLYSLSYYPQPNPNHGWRTITVKLVGPNLGKYHVRTRDGYRLQEVQTSSGNLPESETGSIHK